MESTPRRKFAMNTLINIQEDISRLHAVGVLDRLLVDKTTRKNIMWATDAYSSYGKPYERDEEIKTPFITGAHAGQIKTRARKAFEQQSARTRQHAEVFTPLWVCKRMIDHADEIWFGRPGVFDAEDGPVRFPKGKKWQHYVDSRRLEITCGEAPYLVSRYDVATGEIIPVQRRIGILDRKLRVVSENTETEEDWLRWAVRAFQATYGYEFQGDNLLIARVNMMMSFAEHLEYRWHREPVKAEYRKLANIVAWNLWQMDGLTGTLPYRKAEEEFPQFTLFDQMGIDPAELNRQPRSRIFDWRRENSLEFKYVNTGGRNMKFDFVIGNPPYQEDMEGTSDKPIYNYFMDSAFKIANAVELISPARFLFDAGKTPKSWNQRMLNSEHFKVLEYYEKSADVFANTKIRGGVCISYYDANNTFSAIKVFSPYPTMNLVLKKVLSSPKFKAISAIMYLQNKLNLSSLYEDYPEYKDIISSNGNEKRFESGIFEKLPIFTEEKEYEDEIKVYGVVKKKRVFRFFPLKYTQTPHDNLFKYKAVIMKSNGVGLFGEIIASVDILEPGVGYTQSFIGMGAFDEYESAENCGKYLKTKFARALLSVKKVTQDNPPDTWVCVPLQDFTPNSDIDWSKSIPEIDRQLYAKYGLSQEEIDFIESHVKEMN